MLPKPTHLLLDFFGTVVEYSPSRTTQGYERTHALTTRMGSCRTYDQSRRAWSAAFDRLDQESATNLEEYSSHRVAELALRTILDRTPDEDEIAVAAQSYDDDWSQGIHYPDGMLDALRKLKDWFTLAIVSNTHDSDLVISHLGAMGAGHLFTSVVTSIQVGYRKPHRAIYEAALNALGVDPGRAIFVGDTFIADFVGPESAGISAYLIDQSRKSDVPEARRIDSLLALAGHLKQQGAI